MKILLNFFWLSAIIGINMFLYYWEMIRGFNLEFWNIITVLLGVGYGVISAFIFFLFQIILEKKIKSNYVLFGINLVLIFVIPLFILFIVIYND